MSIFTNYRKHDKEFRAQHGDVIKAGLDCLKIKEGSAELRGDLVNNLKGSLDIHAEWEEAACKYENSVGQLQGFFMCIGTIIGGYTVGKVIEYYMKKD